MTERTDAIADSGVLPTTSEITLANVWDHVLARVGFRRMGHRVAAGLYALGAPGPDAPVLVTANYSMSFDALRAGLAGKDAHLLVLDTQGVNVWCAAGKGTFGTDELVRRIAATNLAQRVRTRTLILPQLGAPGVAAHEVKQRSGFAVEYGPVRAADVGEFLRTRQATPGMRRVRFGLADRLAVSLVDVVVAIVPTALIAAAFYFLGGATIVWAVAAAILAGVLLFPILLPWLPTRAFASKGWLLGLAAALPFAVVAWNRAEGSTGWLRLLGSLTYLLALPPVTAYLALIFTGSTTFTSRSQVRREIFAYIPVLAWLFGAGIALTLVLAGARLWGGGA
ncbi:MAG: mercury methylation corrinoid protein HgcA [Chloroflexi bacterium]|nr:mercury methylation corrinoid protein HgcA [Chloroflexota bacterium]